jgi:type IX secretion system PorP/SprF family membrane protein
MAQNQSVFNAYYLNPFLYNPATAATEYTHIFAHHRQQWVGINDAPVISALTINSLLPNTRVGVGARVSTYQRGLLSTSDVSLAYAYGIPVSKKAHLHFGLTGGAITNAVDMARATDPDDPVFARYQKNNLQATASVGLLYQRASGLSVGFVLPQLLAPSFLESSFSQFNPSPIDNMIVSLGYRKRLDGKMVTKKVKGMKTRVKGTDIYAPLEMYVLYRYAAYGNSQFEAMAKLNLNSNVWVGASYRQAYGAVAHAGFNVKKLSIGYSFELGSQPEAGFSTGTHEVFVSLRVGEKKKAKSVAPVLRSTLTTTKSPQHQARFQSLADDPEHHLDETKETVKRRYYVVVRTLADFAAADAYKRKMLNDKYNAEIFYYPKDKRYHVHIFSTLKSAEAYQEVRNLKNYTKIKDARVLVVVEDK